MKFFCTTSIHTLLLLTNTRKVYFFLRNLNSKKQSFWVFVYSRGRELYQFLISSIILFLYLFMMLLMILFTILICIILTYIVHHIFLLFVCFICFPFFYFVSFFLLISLIVLMFLFCLFCIGDRYPEEDSHDVDLSK